MLASGARSQSKRAGSVFRPELSDSVPARYFAGLELCAFDVAVVIQTWSSCHQQAFEVPQTRRTNHFSSACIVWKPQPIPVVGCCSHARCRNSFGAI